jgi:hypothetical protein
VTNPGDAFPPGDDWIVRQLKSLQDQINANASARSLAASSIGSGGLTVKDGGSITVEAGGSITLPTGTLSAATVAASSLVSSGGNVTAAGGVTAGGNVNVGGAVIAPNNTLISTYARNHQVVTGYVAAYIDSSGNLLATASGLRFKRDISTKHWTPEQWRGIRSVMYRLRAAWILADINGDDLSKVPYLAGVIGEELLALGLDEFVVLDDYGQVFTVHYELLGVLAIDAAQQLADHSDIQDEEIAALKKENSEILARLTAAGI